MAQIGAERVLSVHHWGVPGDCVIERAFVDK
jgi:hypothetical protein